MSIHEGAWDGFTDGVVDAVETVLEANKTDIGLETVTKGDGDRRNNEPVPACYLGPGPSGTTLIEASPRERVGYYGISIQPIVVMQAYREKDAHTPVMQTIQRILNVLDNTGPIGGARDIVIEDPYSPGPLLGDQGAYEVSGACIIQYRKLIERTRSTGA